jgi:hypothetical protein
MARPVVTGLGRRLPMPRSFATFQKGAYDVKISGNAPDEIVLRFGPERPAPPTIYLTSKD